MRTPFVYKCNIDDYRDVGFPALMDHVPRVGEFVEAKRYWWAILEKFCLPVQLEVVRIVHGENGVVIHLHYSDTQQAQIQAKHGKVFNIRS